MFVHLKTLSLFHFRNYSSARIEVDSSPVVITGANGAGKTNILEAISLLTPGRGLRKARIPELDNVNDGTTWAINADVHGLRGMANIGTGRDMERADKRIVKIDGKIARAQTELAGIFSALWLTPQMDTLFTEGNSARRNFIDRLVFSFDGEHAARVNAYEQVMRERNRLLENGNADSHWLNALEQKMAEHGIAIAVARQETVEHLNNAMLLFRHSFPKAHIILSGLVEDTLAHGSALAAENNFRELLAGNRAQDSAAGRALTGIHRMRAEFIHTDKNMPAELCSTGEQKAVLISVILAQARAGARRYGTVPVMLLDEIVSHLDAKRRGELFDELKDLKAQAWITGTDRNMFDSFEAQHVEISNGNILHDCEKRSDETIQKIYLRSS